MALSRAESFTIDVHTHPIPQFYRDALIAAGHTVIGQDLLIDGFVTPHFDIESYLQNRAEYHYDYSILSITAPGVSFLNGNLRAKGLARRLNDQMHEWSQRHPDKLGSFACLPLPDIQGSLDEIQYCLDELDFEGVGLYTNYGGVYLGDPSFDVIMAELDRRHATVLVHPTAPMPETKLPNISTPAVEYTFDTTRVVTNLIFTGTAKKYKNIKMIFSHGGGTVPFLASRIAGQASLPAQGGRDLVESMGLLRNFYFDLAASTSAPQLAALAAFCGSSQVLMGSDFPYFPASYMAGAAHSFNTFAGFSDEEKVAIRHGNALRIFPKTAQKLAKLSK